MSLPPSLTPLCLPLSPPPPPGPSFLSDCKQTVWLCVPWLVTHWRKRWEGGKGEKKRGRKESRQEGMECILQDVKKEQISCFDLLSSWIEAPKWAGDFRQEKDECERVWHQINNQNKTINIPHILSSLKCIYCAYTVYAILHYITIFLTHLTPPHVNLSSCRDDTTPCQQRPVCICQHPQASKSQRNTTQTKWHQWGTAFSICVMPGGNMRP